MKKILITLGLVLGLNNVSFAQTSLIGGESFSVQLPEKYIRTVGINNYAAVQWEHEEKDFYGYIIVENIEDFKLAKLDTSLTGAMEITMSDFKDFKDFKILDTKTYKNDKGQTTIANKISYFDEEEEIVIYYHVNIYLSKNFIYKIYQYGSAQGFKNSETEIDYIAKKINIPS